MDGIGRDGGSMEGEGKEGREIHKIPYRHFVFPTSSSAQRSEQLYEYGLLTLIIMMMMMMAIN